MNKFLFIAAVTGLLYIAACAGSAANVQTNTATAVPAANLAEAQTNDDAPRISLADAKKDYDAGTALFVDVRAESSYKEEHIKGSVNITVDVMAADVNKVPKGRKIIAYCS